VQVNDSFEAASAARLVQTASKYKSHVSLISEEKTANAKSIMGIISLDLHGGDNVKIVVNGEDEQSAAPELKNILSADAGGID
jgi:phosphotransferase system HPr (HPr) family protein